MLERTKKFFTWIAPKSIYEAAVGLFFVAVISVPAYNIAVKPSPTISNDWEVLTPVVRQGENFRISYDIVWRDDCQVTGFRFIVDGAGYRHERTVDTRYVSRGEDKFVISIPVPLAAAPGQAEYRGEVEYVCGPWTRLIPLRRPLTVRQFEIVPALNTSLAMTCPDDRQVAVRAYCRRLPQYSLMERAD